MQILRDNRWLRFLVAGGINTLFGFIVYSLAIAFGAPVWLAVLIGLVCGTIFNFITTGGYVFRDLKPARIPPFLACYGFVYVLNLKLLYWVSLWVVSPIVAQAIITGPIALFAYVVMDRFVFVRRRPNSAKPSGTAASRSFRDVEPGKVLDLAEKKPPRL